MTRITCIVCVLAVWTAYGCVSFAGDRFGIYFDEIYEQNCAPDAVGSVTSCYLVLHDPSAASGIGGWQGELWADPGLTVFSFNIPGDNINLGQLPEIVVGYGTPRLQAENVLLATFMVYATQSGGVYFDKLTRESWLTPLYVEGANSNLRVSMDAHYGGNGEPNAVIGAMPCPEYNGSIGVAVEQMSLGSVKAVYR